MKLQPDMQWFWSISSKFNKRRHPNNSIGMGKVSTINKHRAYVYSELKSTSTRIKKFEILEISLWNQFHNSVFPSVWCSTLFWTEFFLNHCNFTDIVWEMKDFKLSDVSLESNFYSFLRKSHRYNSLPWITIMWSRCSKR